MDYNEQTTDHPPTGEDLDEVQQQQQLLQRRLDQADKATHVHRIELRKAEIVAASCRAGLEAIANAENQPEQSIKNGAY